MRIFNFSFTKTDYEIIDEISRSISLLGGQSDILGTIGSWKDTLSDEDVLSCLKSWNKAKKAELKSANNS